MRSSFCGFALPLRRSTRAALSSVARLFATTPTVLTLGMKGRTPASEMRCSEGRRPHRPHRLAGTRIEPPESVPSEKSASPLETDDAEPLEEPPGMRSGALPLRGVPKKWLSPSRL